jgi:uncharacterized membrane protein YdfJ with MMPL/SSD domain
MACSNARVVRVIRGSVRSFSALSSCRHGRGAAARFRLSPVEVYFVLLFLAFGSLVIPLKSIVLNLLSLSASLGMVKLIFQDGAPSGLLGFTPVGAIDVNLPVLIVAIAVGLAMDYEMFLVAS